MPFLWAFIIFVIFCVFPAYVYSSMLILDRFGASLFTAFVICGWLIIEMGTSFLYFNFAGFTFKESDVFDPTKYSSPFWINIIGYTLFMGALIYFLVFLQKVDPKNFTGGIAW